MPDHKGYFLNPEKIVLVVHCCFPPLRVIVPFKTVCSNVLLFINRQKILYPYNYTRLGSCHEGNSHPCISPG